MTGYNFTDRVRRALVQAREEAQRLHHEAVGPEHVLLGVIKEGNGVAITALERLHIDPSEVRERIVAKAPPGTVITGGPDIPYTRRGKMVLELAMEEARDLYHEYVGTEHLLLGVAAEVKGIGAKVLKELGADLEILRAMVLQLLGQPTPPRPRDVLLQRAAKLVKRLRGQPLPDAAQVRLIAVELETLIDQLRSGAGDNE